MRFTTRGVIRRVDPIDEGGTRCTGCRMLQTLCICDEIPRLDLRTRLCLVMHRDETIKTTNTGRLAALSLLGSSTFVHGGKTSPLERPDFQGRRPLVLFPFPSATPLTREFSQGAPITLVVPDGTWRQARKMCRRVPWLHGIQAVTLPDGPESAYRLRARVKAGGLATAEAIARALGILEGPEIEDALARIFALMVERTLLSRGTL